jgi:hypothetical protein
MMILAQPPLAQPPLAQPPEIEDYLQDVITKRMKYLEKLINMQSSRQTGQEAAL